MFYSRRIGIENGQIVSTRAGARVTGRVGKYTVGLLNIQTGESVTAQAASTNFSVVRLRRDIFRRSTIGVIGTHRFVSLDGLGSNQVFGADAKFAFYQNLNIDTYYAETRTPGLAGAETSYRGRIANRGDRYGFEYEHLMVGENFNPEMGFLRRSDFRLNHVGLDFTPRANFTDLVRKFQYGLNFDHFTSGAGVLETREVEGRFEVEFENGDDWNVEYTNTYEAIDQPFFISSGVTVPVGEYEFQRVGTSYQLGQQRPVSGWLSAGHGSFWNGTRTDVGYRGRVELSSKLSLEPRIQFDWVDLPTGSFTSSLVGARVTYTLSPRTFVGALVQYNSGSETVSTKVRLRWEYEPGSDLFVVYSEGRDTETVLDPRRTSRLQNRGLAIKMTRLWRF